MNKLSEVKEDFDILSRAIALTGKTVVYSIFAGDPCVITGESTLRYNVATGKFTILTDSGKVSYSEYEMAYRHFMRGVIWS